MSWLKVKYSMPTSLNVQSCDMTIHWARESSSLKVVWDLANMVKYVKENNNQFYAVSHNFSHHYCIWLYVVYFSNSIAHKLVLTIGTQFSLPDIFLSFLNECLRSIFVHAFLTCQYVNILAFNCMDVKLKWFTTFFTM